MKKTIIAVVVLVAALAGLKYFSSKNAVTPPVAPAAPQQEQAGVALPETARNEKIDTTSVYVEPAGSGSYDSIRLPEAAMAVKGACEEGSIKNILESHGRTWGYFVGNRIAMDGKKSQEIYDGLGDYYACVAVSRFDVQSCNELPGEAEKDGVKADLGSSPMGYCRAKAGTLLFKAFVAGKTKDTANCMGFLSDWDSANLARISPPDFCQAAGKGPEAAMAYTKEKLPNMYSMAEKTMGFSRRACGSDAFCLANSATWEGIQSGDPSKCGRDTQPHCAAMAQKNIAACGPILSDLSKKYCGYYKDLLKAGGGFAGLTTAEVKEELRIKAEKKALEDKQRKEQEAVTKQTNDKIRKMMNKQGGN